MVTELETALEELDRSVHIVIDRIRTETAHDYAAAGTESPLLVALYRARQVQALLYDVTGKVLAARGRVAE